MPRVKLIFDQRFGIANCWYPLDSSIHETVSNVTGDLLSRFGVKDLVLEMDGYTFLEDGSTRLLFKDNDEISVRSVANKRIATEQDDCRKKIKLENKLPVESSLDVVDLVDSADEYESSLDLGEESETLINPTAILSESAQDKDENSFHLSVNATSAIQDQDSSDASSVSLADVEMSRVDDQVWKNDSSTTGKEPSGNDNSADSKGISRELEKDESSKDTGDKNVYFKDDGNVELAKERFVFYDGGKPEDMTIVMKKTKGKIIMLILDDDGGKPEDMTIVTKKSKGKIKMLILDDDGHKPEDMTIVTKNSKGKIKMLILDDDGRSKTKCFYELANILRNKKESWVPSSFILSRVQYGFYKKYGYSCWTDYLKAGASMNILRSRKNISSNRIEVNMSERMCREILDSVSSNSKDYNKFQAANEIDDLGDHKEKTISQVRVVLRKNAEPLIPALPSFPVSNFYRTASDKETAHVKQTIIPAFPAPPIITGQNVVSFQPPLKSALPVSPTIKSYRAENDRPDTKHTNPELIQPLPEIKAQVNLDNGGEKSVQWGMNDSFFDQNKKHSDSQQKGTSNASLPKRTIEPEDFSKSKTLTDQYKCFIDLAKYSEKFGPEEWIPGNAFISQHHNFYLKYGQQRWKTYLEWGKKLRLLDFQLIKSEIHVRMSLLMRRMIINLCDPPSGELSTDR
jgi:hypothetical protein